jgi:hypothetical protein
MFCTVAEGERTEESREAEGQSPEDERSEKSESSESSGSDGERSGGSDKFDEDAPGGASVPADGVGDWDPPHESEDESNFSETDAMGQDKRRTIIGQGYGPSKGRQLLYYGAFLAFLIAAFFGFRIAVSELDKAPAKDKDAAPWAGTQVPPKQFE